MRNDLDRCIASPPWAIVIRGHHISPHGSNGIPWGDHTCSWCHYSVLTGKIPTKRLCISRYTVPSLSTRGRRCKAEVLVYKLPDSTILLMTTISKTIANSIRFLNVSVNIETRSLQRLHKVFTHFEISSFAVKSVFSQETLF